MMILASIKYELKEIETEDWTTELERIGETRANGNISGLENDEMNPFVLCKLYKASLNTMGISFVSFSILIKWKMKTERSIKIMRETRTTQK